MGWWRRHWGRTDAEKLGEASPWIRAMRAAPLFTLPFSMRHVSESQEDAHRALEEERRKDEQQQQQQQQQSGCMGIEEEEKDDDAFKTWMKSLLQFHFGDEGVQYALGEKMPSELDGKDVLEVPFVHVFGKYLTQAIMDKKSWLLRQAGLAVIQCCVDDDTGWLKKYLGAIKVSDHKCVYFSFADVSPPFLFPFLPFLFPFSLFPSRSKKNSTN